MCQRDGSSCYPHVFDVGCLSEAGVQCELSGLGIHVTLHAMPQQTYGFGSTLTQCGPKAVDLRSRSLGLMSMFLPSGKAMVTLLSTTTVAPRALHTRVEA